MVNDNWKADKEVLEVLKRARRMKERKRGFFGRSSNTFKRAQLEKVLGKREVDFGYDVFIIKNPADYAGAPWEETGRSGLDGEQIVFHRPIPKGFQFLWIAGFTQAYCLHETGERFEVKIERDLSAPRVRTYNSDDVGYLVGEGGYFLVDQKTTTVTETSCTSGISPVDWIDSQVERTLYTLVRVA